MPARCRTGDCGRLQLAPRAPCNKTALLATPLAAPLERNWNCPSHVSLVFLNAAENLCKTSLTSALTLTGNVKLNVLHFGDRNFKKLSLATYLKCLPKHRHVLLLPSKALLIGVCHNKLGKWEAVYTQKKKEKKGVSGVSFEHAATIVTWRACVLFLVSNQGCCGTQTNALFVRDRNYRSCRDNAKKPCEIEYHSCGRKTPQIEFMPLTLKAICTHALESHPACLRFHSCKLGGAGYFVIINAVPH